MGMIPDGNVTESRSLEEVGGSMAEADVSVDPRHEGTPGPRRQVCFGVHGRGYCHSPVVRLDAHNQIVRYAAELRDSCFRGREVYQKGLADHEIEGIVVDRESGGVPLDPFGRGNPAEQGAIGVEGHDLGVGFFAEDEGELPRTAPDLEDPLSTDQVRLCQR